MIGSGWPLVPGTLGIRIYMGGRVQAHLCRRIPAPHRGILNLKIQSAGSPINFRRSSNWRMTITHNIYLYTTHANDSDAKQHTSGDKYQNHRSQTWVSRIHYGLEGYALAHTLSLSPTISSGSLFEAKYETSRDKESGWKIQDVIRGLPLTPKTPESARGRGIPKTGVYQ